MTEGRLHVDSMLVNIFSNYRNVKRFAGGNYNFMTSESRKPSPVFVRDATGLVRDVGFFDIVVYNMLPIAPGLTLALYLFWIPGAFPGGSLVWAMLIACFLAIFIATTFGLMSMAMPRIRL